MVLEAWVLSVEATHRYARSALPTAPVQPPARRWPLLPAAVQRAVRRLRSAPPGTGRAEHGRSG